MVIGIIQCLASVIQLIQVVQGSGIAVFVVNLLPTAAFLHMYFKKHDVAARKIYYFVNLIFFIILCILAVFIVIFLIVAQQYIAAILPIGS